MGIIAAIAAWGKALAGYFGWAKQRDAERNSAPMIAAKTAQIEQDQVDAERKAIAARDTAKIRRDLGFSEVRTFLGILGIYAAAGLALMLLPACVSTVAPPAVVSHQAAWSGTNQDSGFIGWTPAGEGILSPGGHELYLDLAGHYGTRASPPVVGDACRPTATNTWLIDQEHLELMLTMRRWQRGGK